MLNRMKRPRQRRMVSADIRCGLCLLAASILLCLFFQTACLFKKSKPPVALAPIRMVILPFNVPAGNTDLRWVALAAPVVLAKESENAPDLVPVPLWEAMPTAIESGGASRSFTPESAASVANWLTAKWATLGELSPTKTGASVILDFIPARSNQVPFRYMKTGRIDSLGPGFHDAVRQFLRYLVARPPGQTPRDSRTMTSLKPLAEALDREYGWFVDADPGKAQEIVADLARTDERLARFLFNPSLYPALAKTK